jgi:hypothetical protein
MVPDGTGGPEMKFHFVLEIQVGKWKVSVHLTFR